MLQTSRAEQVDSGLSLNPAIRRRAEDPAWVDDLLQLLRHPVPRQAMPLPDIAQEIIDWIDFANADSWSKNAKGLRRELDDALRSISPSLRRLLATELREVRVSINAGTFGTAQPAARQPLRRALVALNKSLASPNASGAAWDDLIAALRQDNPVRDATVALTALQAAGEQLGGDEGPRRKSAASTIEAFNWEARQRSDATEGPLLATRLEEAREIIIRPEDPADCAVWLEYDHIAVQNYEWTHGPVTLLAFGWALPNARNPKGEEFAHRDELRELLVSHDDFPPDTDLTRSFRAFARVHVPGTPPSEAVQRAQDLLEVVRQVAVPDTGLRWRRGELTATFIEGWLVRSEYEPQDPSTWVDASRAHFTSGRLSERAPAILDGLERAPLPLQLREALRIMANVEPNDRRPRAAGDGAIIDDRALLVLQLQAVEHVAAWMQMDPQQLIDQLTETWAVSRVLARAAETANRLARRSESGILLQLGRQIGEINWDLIIDHERDLLDLTVGPFERADSRAAFNVLKSPPHFLAARARAEDALALERGRHRRVRNALAHGNPFQGSALRSVARLGRSLANSSLALAIDAHLAGELPTARLNDAVAAARSNVLRAQHGDSIADAARPASGQTAPTPPTSRP